MYHGGCVQDEVVVVEVVVVKLVEVELLVVERVVVGGNASPVVLEV